MLDIVIATARQAGALLRNMLGQERTLDLKGEIDLVTDADRASEALILEALTAEFPDHRILAEESGDNQAGSPYIWLIDPLDGTTNYAHGLPLFAVSIALAYEGTLELGVVYDPMRDELFAAQRGHGAHCNGRLLRVSEETQLIRSCCSTGFPYNVASKQPNNLEQFCRIIRHARAVRRIGSAALDLSYVAAGRFEAHWEMGLKPWDSAAGALLILEAGGKLSTWDGGPWSVTSPTLAASNGGIHNELLSLLVE